MIIKLCGKALKIHKLLHLSLVKNWDFVKGCRIVCCRMLVYTFILYVSCIVLKCHENMNFIVRA